MFFVLYELFDGVYLFNLYFILIIIVCDLFKKMKEIYNLIW